MLGPGQVEEFLLMTVEEALDTIKTDLAKWKPNCALVMIDFALRHGFLDPDHEVRGRKWLLRGRRPHRASVSCL